MASKQKNEYTPQQMHAFKENAAMIVGGLSTLGIVIAVIQAGYGTVAAAVCGAMAVGAFFRLEALNATKPAKEKAVGNFKRGNYQPLPEIQQIEEGDKTQYNKKRETALVVA